MSRLAASSSGAVGAERCQASMTAAAWVSGQVEGRRRRRKDSPEKEGRYHAEVGAAGAAPRTEQILVVMLVALDDASIGQDDPCTEQVIRGQPVLATEDA
jgi:hypothetical protein